MYNFILYRWVMGVYAEVQIQACVTKGYITQAQADEIKATPRS